MLKKREPSVLSSQSSVLYRSRYVMPMSSPIIEDGGVVVRDGIIVAVGNQVDLKREFSPAISYDLGEVILMPGLINAHCHLDYTMMKNQLEPGSGFTAWIQGLNKIKFSLREEEIVAAIIQGATELHQWGCTAAANIVAFPSLLKKLPSPLLRL